MNIFEDMCSVGFLENHGNRLRMPQDEWKFYAGFLTRKETKRKQWREASDRYRNKDKNTDDSSVVMDDVIHDASMTSAPYRIEENSIEETDSPSDGVSFEKDKSGEKIKTAKPQGGAPGTEVGFPSGVVNGDKPVTDLRVLQNLWNEIVPELASTFGIGHKKAKKCLDTVRKANLTLEQWRTRFQRISKSQFLLYQKNTKTSLEWFLSDFDRLCGLDNARYDDGQTHTGGNSKPPRKPDAGAMAIQKLHEKRRKAKEAVV